jgi:hypothetical protein
MPATCLDCKRLLGCPYLVSDNSFSENLLIVSDSPRECPEFEEVGAREKIVRDRMYKGFGMGYVRTLHSLPELLMEGVRRGEEDELMYENIPDFQGPALLRPGMSTLEREDVLRHETDDEGRVIVEQDELGVGHKLARPGYHYKAYASDPDGPIKADKNVTMLWNNNQVIEHILKVEVDAGLLQKVKKTPKASQPEENQEEKKTMPRSVTATRTIRTAAPTTPAAAPAKAPAAKAAAPAAIPGVRRATPKAAPAAPVARAAVPAPAAAPAPGAGRVANPPARRAAPTATVATGRPAATAPVQAAVAAPKAAAPSVTPEMLDAAVHRVVDPLFAELLTAVKAGQQTTIECATIIHDIAGQTGGTFQIPKTDEDGNQLCRPDGTLLMAAAQLYPNPFKIYAHVEGVAYDPENLQLIDADEVAQDDQAPELEEEVVEEDVAEGEA